MPFGPDTRGAVDPLDGLKSPPSPLSFQLDRQVALGNGGFHKDSCRLGQRGLPIKMSPLEYFLRACVLTRSTVVASSAARHAVWTISVVVSSRDADGLVERDSVGAELDQGRLFHWGEPEHSAR
jgi:hypothetical protein